jgi:hypothetical protein
MTLAPIILFVYNRPEHTRRTIESLQKNKFSGESDLFIYADGPRQPEHEQAVKEVQDYLATITGFKKIEIKKRDKNFGLASNIIDGVTDIVNQFNKIIVLEDDMILSAHFLEFMNEALLKYENIEEVISIHGYCVPIDYPHSTFFLRGADCWGWATWRRGWQYFNQDSVYLLNQLKQKKLFYDFDFNGHYDYSGMLKKQITGEVDSWAIRWYASAYLNNKLTLYSSHSLVQNIGGDGSGTHEQNADHNQTNLSNHKIALDNIPVEESKLARKLIGKYHSKYQSKKDKLRTFLRWGY